MNKLTLLFTYLTLFVIGIILGGVIFWQLQIAGVQRTQGTSNKHYFSDEFFAYGKDSSGKPFLAEILFQRKQNESGEYTHYYVVEMLSQGKYAESKIQKKYPLSEIDQKGFLTKFDAYPESDLSTRSSYRFSYDVNSVQYTLVTETLNGDFLVRNKPNYSKYVDMGKGTISFDGNSIPVSIAHVSSYAENSNEYVYFDGFYQLNSVAHLVILWDEAGNAYLIDQSKVSSSQKNYQSHTWVLRKNSQGKTKKAFAATIDYDNNEFPSEWKISIPTFDDTKISFTVQYNNEQATGVATGTVSDKNGTRKISGYALITHY